MSTAKKFILHVDDDQNDLLLVEHAFRAANLAYGVKSATDGEMAIAFLSELESLPSLAPNSFPSVVLLDLKMPRKSGFEVLAWIRNQSLFKRMLVFVFTSSRHQEDIDRAYELGANAYLVKPVGFERLVEELRAMDAWLNLNEKPSLKNAFSYCLPPAGHGILGV